jgi:hypothetical protein
MDTTVQRAHTIMAADNSKNIHKALAVTNWSVASRALYYSEQYSSEVFLIDNRHDQFSLWRLHDPVGYDLLFLNTHYYNRDIRNELRCNSVESAESYDIMLNGGKVDTIEYVWCRNYGGFTERK